MDRELTRAQALIARPAEGALTPSLPLDLRLVLGSGILTITLPIEQGGGIVERERPEWDPPQLAPPILAVAHSAYEALLDHLESIDEAEIALIIGRLKAHNWRYARKVSSEFAETVLDIDWTEDLCEFPKWAINHACRAWRRTQDESPIIAGIRRLCEEAVVEDRRSLRLLRRLLDAQQRQAA